MKKYYIEVESVEAKGNDGFYEASLNLKGHDECITVFGGNLTECMERTMIIVNAFNAADKE